MANRRALDNPCHAAVAPSRILGCETIWFNRQVQRTTEATAAKCKAAATMVNRCQTSW